MVAKIKLKPAAKMDELHSQTVFLDEVPSPQASFLESFTRHFNFNFKLYLQTMFRIKPQSLILVSS